MNIVVLSEAASLNGGKAKVAFDGARALAMAGHQVHLICGVGPVAEELKERANLTVHCLGQFDILEDPNRLRAMVLGWWNPRSRTYVGNIMDSLDPQDTIVHVHSWTKALSPSAVRAALDRKFAVVVTIHDFLLTCPTGTLFKQDTQQKCSLRPMSLSCICSNCDVRSYRHKLWRVGRRAVQSRFGHMPSGIHAFIVPSQFAYDLLRPYLPHDASVYCVPNTIDVDKDLPVDVASNKTFLFMGRLTPEKGAVMFARAAALEHVPCRFVGEGMAKEEVARANSQATLSGWMSHREGLKALRSARALVFPSLWYEVQPLVVLEAAGSGVPSIVSDTCAARESVVDGVTGLYFRNGDESDLRAKITILKDPNVAARMGRAAYDRFWSSPGWSLDLHRQRLEATYRTILSPRHNIGAENDSSLVQLTTTNA